MPDTTPALPASAAVMPGIAPAAVMPAFATAVMPGLTGHLIPTFATTIMPWPLRASQRALWNCQRGDK